MIQGKTLINPFALSKRIGRPLILDGAMGSMLQQSGLKSEGSLWMSLANITHPDMVFSIHSKYVKAGADIITTNTFRTNPFAVKNYNSKLSAEKLVKESVKIAFDAAKGFPVFVAGSNAPAEDCYQRKRTISQKELQINHHNHINLLMDNGCHFILNETQSHLDEIKIICKFCYEHNILHVFSLYVDERLNILSGEKIFDVIPMVLDFAPLAIGINCIRQNTFMKIYKRLKSTLIWGAYLNCLPSQKPSFSLAQAGGSGDFTDDNIVCGVSPTEYKITIENILPKMPSFIGGCCGSTPGHINKIKQLLDGKIRN